MRVLLYFLCSVLMLLLSFGVRRKRKGFDIFIIIIISIIPAVFSAFLPYSISDRSIYASRFMNFYPQAYLGNIQGIFTQTSVEYGFALYNLFVYKILPKPEFFFFLTSFICNCCLLSAFYRIKQYMFAGLVFIYLCTWYPFLTFYSIRQMLAVGFVSIAMAIYINNNELKKCWKSVTFWSVAAMLFHGTAIVVFIWIAICELFQGKRKIKLLMSLLSVGAFVMWPILNWVLSWEIFSNKFIGSKTIGTVSIEVVLKGIPMLAAAVLGLLYRNRLNAKETKIDCYINGTLLFGFMWIYAINSYWVFRFSFYGIFLFCVLLNSIRKYILNQQFARSIYCLIILGSLGVFYRELILYMKLIFI